MPSTNATYGWTLSLVFLFLLLQIHLNDSTLISSSFKCSKDMTSKSDRYSYSYNSIAIKLTRLFCGKAISANIGGFYVRPGDKDPESASTTTGVMVRKPKNELDFSQYKGVRIYDILKKGYVPKTSKITNIWPTVLTMEDIAFILTRLVDQCNVQYVLSVITRALHKLTPKV